MRPITLFLAILLCTSLSAQSDLNTQHIIDLGKHYSRFMFASEASKELIKQLGAGYDENLSTSVEFIKEVTAAKNKILTEKFLQLPDETTLKVIYIIDALHQNPNLENPEDPTKLVERLKNEDIPIHILVDQYYQSIFTSVGNKNKPFNMSKVNFNMNELGLSTDRQKAIFYLRCLDMCGTQIFGYMNIVNPPNTKKALEYIEKFPKFDGLEYYQYTDFGFEDFEMVIFNDKGIQSYKDHFINELFQTLLNHAVCLKNEEGGEALQQFLLQSELKNETLWKHTELEEVLKSIFQER